MAPAADGHREFETFASGSSADLLKAAYLLCGDRQAAEDLVQTALMRTARRWREARRAPDAYARVVLVNLARDAARRRQRRVREVLIDETHHPGDRRRSVAERSAADHADRLLGRESVLVALAALPERQREVIVLRFYADLSVADTAAAMGASQGTVMSYTSRALSRLRELLGEPAEQPDTPISGEVPHGL
ncbi:MAG: SigE family RNA polymerase sigma factor [Solirubrobacteraceae bacterium]